MCNKFRPHVKTVKVHLLPFWPMDTSLPGAIQTMVVTAPQFKISSRMCSKLKPQVAHSLPSWLMDPWCPGAIQVVLVTAQKFEIGPGMSKKFRPQTLHFPQFWQMDHWLPGAIHAIHSLVVTGPHFKISSRMRAKFNPWVLVVPCWRSWPTDLSLRGAIQWRWRFRSTWRGGISVPAWWHADESWWCEDASPIPLGQLLRPSVDELQWPHPHGAREDGTGLGSQNWGRASWVAPLSAFSCPGRRRTSSWCENSARWNAELERTDQIFTLHRVRVRWAPSRERDDSED